MVKVPQRPTNAMQPMVLNINLYHAASIIKLKTVSTVERNKLSPFMHDSKNPAAMTPHEHFYVSFIVANKFGKRMISVKCVSAWICIWTQWGFEKVTQVQNTRTSVISEPTAPETINTSTARIFSLLEWSDYPVQCRTQEWTVRHYILFLSSELCVKIFRYSLQTQLTLSQSTSFLCPQLLRRL